MTLGGNICAELTQAVLDQETVAALFADLAVCTQVRSIQTKGEAHDHASLAPRDLDDAHARLMDGRLRSVQIRYRWQDQEWCDTLFHAEQGLRLVRWEILPS